MARNIGAACRRCRRENLKLYLKGDRCYSDKCSFERRAFGPGQHGQARFRKVSDYATQLREKQKVKSMYGMLEGQFRLNFQKADSQKGVTGENLLILLERRLDNTIFRMGFRLLETRQGNSFVIIIFWSMGRRLIFLHI